MSTKLEMELDWARAAKVIQSWLKERHEVMVLFYDLCQQRPFLDAKPMTEPLQKLCNLLIDYVSYGEFSVFELIAKAHEANPLASQPLSKDLMVKLLRTTNTVLTFQSRYADNTNVNLQQLDRDLGVLAEQFAQRLDCEDQLFTLYVDAVSALQIPI